MIDVRKALFGPLAHGGVRVVAGCSFIDTLDNHHQLILLEAETGRAVYLVEPLVRVPQMAEELGVSNAALLQALEDCGHPIYQSRTNVFSSVAKRSDVRLVVEHLKAARK